MKLEDEIKMTKPFENENKKAIVNVLYTSNVIADKSIEALKHYDINEQHYNILRILKGRHPNSARPGEIKEVLLNKRGDLTRLLDKLCRMKLIDRDTNPKNRRMVDVSISKEGITLLNEMEQKLDVAQKTFQLSQAEAKELNKLLDKLRN